MLHPDIATVQDDWTINQHYSEERRSSHSLLTCAFKSSGCFTNLHRTTLEDIAVVKCGPDKVENLTTTDCAHASLLRERRG